MGYVIFNPNKFKPDPKPEPKAKKQPKPIKKQSDKLVKNTREYYFDRKVFLALPGNEKCFVDGCKRKANTVEHTKGRQGFADKWARDHNIPLLLDQRFWEPCCWGHNTEFEKNAELSNKYQLSKIHDGKKIDKTN